MPNLETKFVTADTIVGIKKNKVGDQPEMFENPKIKTLKQDILNVRHKNFNVASAKEKRKLRDEDAKLRKELLNFLGKNENAPDPEDAKQISQWEPYDQNNSSSFFDTEWMFGIKKGFDIVIGNPPYIQLQKNGGKLAIQYKNLNFKTFTTTGDIYTLFYKKGYDLLKDKGILCFITSNK